MQPDRGGEQLIILPSNNTTMASIVSIHKGAISGTQMLVATNNCLNKRKVITGTRDAARLPGEWGYKPSMRIYYCPLLRPA